MWRFAAALACALACAAAALLNPYGARVYQVALEHLRDSSALGAFGVIEEWRSLRLGEYPLYWALLAAAFGLLLRDLFLRRPGAWLIPLGP